MRLANIIELLAHVSPVGCFGTATVIVLAVAGKAIDMNDAVEILQVFLWSTSKLKVTISQFLPHDGLSLLRHKWA
jgi:hypothetical protein